MLVESVRERGGSAESGRSPHMCAQARLYSKLVTCRIGEIGCQGKIHAHRGCLYTTAARAFIAITQLVDRIVLLAWQFMTDEPSRMLLSLTWADG